MWIRNQDRSELKRTSGVWAYDKRIHASDTGGTIGKYATRERCLEIMDNLQSAIISGQIVFQMPKM